MGILNMAKTIKKIHPNYLVLYKQGVFYHAYGKDSYIISAIFDYMLKTQQNVATCGFSEKALKRVTKILEEQKVNYMLIDPRNNYDVDAQVDFKEENTYDEEFKKAYLVIKQRRRIEHVKENFEEFIGEKNFRTVLKKIEKVINENRKI